MRIRNRRRMGLTIAGAVVAVLVASGPLWGAHLGRRIDWLRVRNVEISGTRLLTPGEVLEASGIVEGDHLLDESATWEQALLAHPVIAAARVTRKPPHTLRVRVEEKVPVALVTDGTLKLATAEGEVLPIEPYRSALDLPVVRGSFDDSTRAAATRLALAEAGRLAALAPGLLGEVSEIARSGSREDALILDHAAAEIVLPIGVPASRIEELYRVMADLESRYPAGEESRRRARPRIDLSFDEQVVVRPSFSRERS